MTPVLAYPHLITNLDFEPEASSLDRVLVVQQLKCLQSTTVVPTCHNSKPLPSVAAANHHLEYKPI